MTVTFILGTRPEVIKLATVAREAARRGWRVRIVHTGQHLRLTEPLLRFFGLMDIASEFIDLDARMEKPSLSGLSARLLSRLDEELGTSDDTEMVIIQGDTSSAFIGAYWAFCRQLPIAHVEAGLRSSDLIAPFPEEANRILISRLADLHFAPTPHAMRQLLSDGVKPERVYLSGNTSIDALLYTLGRIDEGQIDPQDALPEDIRRFVGSNPTVLVTAHRHAHIGEPLANVCSALRSLARTDARLRLVLPVDPNPKIRTQILSELSRHPQILLCEPLPYVPFVQLMARADLIVTDSGGLQEEAPTLRKPILVTRETTERQEGVEAGFARLVGTDAERIVSEAQNALSGGLRSEKDNPYGDGRSAARIIASLAILAADRRARSTRMPEITETLAAGQFYGEHSADLFNSAHERSLDLISSQEPDFHPETQSLRESRGYPLRLADLF